MPKPSPKSLQRDNDRDDDDDDYMKKAAHIKTFAGKLSRDIRTLTDDFLSAPGSEKLSVKLVRDKLTFTVTAPPFTNNLETWTIRLR